LADALYWLHIIPSNQLDVPAKGLKPLAVFLNNCYGNVASFTFMDVLNCPRFADTGASNNLALCPIF